MKYKLKVLLVLGLVLICIGGLGVRALALRSRTNTLSTYSNQLPGSFNLPAFQVKDQSAFTLSGWKTPQQLASDLETVIQGGYSNLCLFDLQGLWEYPDPQYVSLLKQYAERGVKLTIYVQDLSPNQTILDFTRYVGAASVIVYNEDASALFKDAGFKTYWWAGAAYPPNHTDLPQYFAWPDLRSEAVREAIADWAVKVPEGVDGGLSLDYIRWNGVGNGRTADQITDLLLKIRSRWSVVGKGELSAAVYPYLGKNLQDGGALSVGQEWNRWLEEGLVDFVIPMAYQSSDIPWLVSDEWKAYDKNKVVPCLSVKISNP